MASFFSLDLANIANIVRAVSETGIIAVGMTFVIITAGIDLSVGAVLSLSSVLTATIMTTGGWGAAGDAGRRDRHRNRIRRVARLISTRFRLEPFIVTLAGLQIARGLALVISNNQYINISYGVGRGSRRPVFSILGERLLGTPCPSRRLSSSSSPRLRPSCSISPALVATSCCRRQRTRRAALRRAGDRRQDRGLRDHRHGVRDRRVVHAGQFNFGSANDGTGYELTAIAGVVIGGTILFGGSGSMVELSPAP